MVQVETWQEAADKNFHFYMVWCFQYCDDRCKVDNMFQTVYESADKNALEAIWAKRYWFYKNGQYE